MNSTEAISEIRRIQKVNADERKRFEQGVEVRKHLLAEAIGPFLETLEELNRKGWTADAGSPLVPRSVVVSGTGDVEQMIVREEQQNYQIPVHISVRGNQPAAARWCNSPLPIAIVWDKFLEYIASNYRDPEAKQEPTK